MLEDRLFAREREHELELIGQQKRLAKICEEEVLELKLQNRKAEETFNVERSAWDVIIGHNEEEREKLKKAFDEERAKLN